MIVIARKYGQLGNRLFLFAHLIAAARHYGVELRNPCFGDYADLFPSTRHDRWCRYDQHLINGRSPRGPAIPPTKPPSRVSRDALTQALSLSTKLLHQTGFRRYPAHVIRLRSGEACSLTGARFAEAVASGRPVLLQGWLFRSGELWQQHAAAIREFFQLSDRHRNRIATIIEAARRETDCLVGVHIRRGDYATFQNGRYYYDDAAYAGWMHQVREQLPGRRVRFLICSHETFDADAFAGLETTAGPGVAVEDMYALAKTDLIIGPPSTFTAWGAFMGDTPRLELHSASQSITVPESLHSESLHSKSLHSESLHSETAANIPPSPEQPPRNAA